MNRVQLRDFLVDRFDLDKLFLLCLECGFSYEELGGSGKPGKALDIVLKMERLDKFSELETKAIAMADKTALLGFKPVTMFGNLAQAHFKKNDVDDLCVIMGFSADEIEGSTLTRRAVELWLKVARLSKLPQFVAAVAELHPHIQMPQWQL